MLYGFTATKHGTPSIPISKIQPRDYQPVWDKFNKYHITIVYKFKHHGNNHIHFHGLLQADYIKYADIVIDGYSIDLDKDVNYERWHNYCKHEETETLTKLTKERESAKGRALLARVMNTGATYRTPKPQTYKTLLKITILGKI